jgi:hypothetical protein
MATASEGTIRLRRPHPKQEKFIYSKAKRKVIRAGRRGGKTTGIAILAVLAFLDKRRVLYAAPTQEQIDRFWVEIKKALREPIESGALYKNETLHIIDVPDTENRIRAKTAWDADTLRGDYADLLIMDEFQLMSEDAWNTVGAPMLADNNGDAVFIYTPPSMHSTSRSKARDPQHAAKMYKKAAADTSGRWEAFHFSSYDNPHISRDALDDLAADMTALAYEQEILALDKDEAPGALWKRDLIERLRVDKAPDLVRIVVGVDPPGGVTECGIVAAGLGRDGHGYVLVDASFKGTPGEWSKSVVELYEELKADRIVGENNNGGDMVEHTIRTAPRGQQASYRNVHASRNKETRAEPVAAKYERGMVHHVGNFSLMENELCLWEPKTGMPSPNRLDALVWALWSLMIIQPGELPVEASRYA